MSIWTTRTKRWKSSRWQTILSEDLTAGSRRKHHNLAQIDPVAPIPSGFPPCPIGGIIGHAHRRPDPLRHEVIPKCGSFEVPFPDGSPSRLLLLGCAGLGRTWSTARQPWSRPKRLLDLSAIATRTHDRSLTCWDRRTRVRCYRGSKAWVSRSLNLDRALGPQAPVGTANPGGGLSFPVPDFLFKNDHKRFSFVICPRS